MSIIRHITLPGGFVAGATACQIKPSGKKDLAIIAANNDASMAVMTTSNQITGAPIQWIRSIAPKGCGKARAMVINSGNSNVCTGKAGLKNAQTMAKMVAGQLDTTPEKILVASTGIIGHPLPMDKVKTGIAAAGSKLSVRNDQAVAEAILTTDLRPKSAVVQTTLNRKKITVSGIAKGSGMIAPSLATMIAVITTDAAIAPTVLKKALKQAVHCTFNAVTVDSDQSTSDVVAVFASGKAGNETIKPNTPAYTKFVKVLTEVCNALAMSIAADGEGATRVVKIAVTGAKSDAHAEIAAKSVANSPLVKTAIHGADPNWGRIAMALGKSAATVDAQKLTIAIAGHKVFARALPAKFDEKIVSEAMKQPEVLIECKLGLSKGAFTALTCDLSREYITINADYTT